jgi:hypothetical protein
MAHPQDLLDKDYVFRMNEMAWFDQEGEINQTLTELSTIKDDEEFEKWIFLIRSARCFAKGSKVI